MVSALGVVSASWYIAAGGARRAPLDMGPEQNFAPEGHAPITVVLVDDERLIRAALARTLSDSGIELVGEAVTGEDAIEIVVDVRPDVVLMDLRLPGLSGVQAIEQLGLLAPASRVLVLTRSEQNRVVEAIVAGASGYILKSAPPEAIISAIRATATGGSVLSPQIAGKLLQRIRELDIPVKSTDGAAGAIRAALTDRELEIFTRLASGHSNHEIAHELTLSTNTVANHIASILAKLHLENRIQAAVQAVRSGIS
jgi:DNA-binding NarL/FixJ family response regulator